MREERFDLVVIGFGAAGAAAALTAARAGASVALIEKQPAGAHYPSTRMSGGLMMTVADPVAAMSYLIACAGGMIPEEVLRAWAERAASLRPWLKGIGLDSVPLAGGWHPHFAGHDALEVVAIPKRGLEEIEIDEEERLLATRMGTLPKGMLASGMFGNGRELFAALEAAVRGTPGIQVFHGHAADSLLRETRDAPVTGVEAVGEAGHVRFHARCGTVLSCGGYEFDERMKLDYLKAYPIHFYGCRANTGDGIRMAQEVGADLWHMNQMIGRAIAHFELDGEPMNFNIAIAPAPYVFTDKYGRRFTNEDLQAMSKEHFYCELLDYDVERMEYPRIPAFWFFDRRRMEAGHLVLREAGLVGVGLYDWSPDNRRELERGWIAEGDDVETAARKAGVADPAGAARTIAEYNEACRRGVDAFGRSAASLIPLEPPFYCMPVYPGGASTCGGPRRDGRARILDVRGRPIPGLYGAGELGEAVGLLYPSGGANLSDGLCFGQIAAESALADPIG